MAGGMFSLRGAKRHLGSFEGFLSEQRIKVANKLIDSESRKGKILDIGCGGYPCFLIKTPFSQKFGLDRLVSNRNQKECLESYQIHLISFDFEKDSRVHFEDGTFDVVTMLAVFEHIEPSKIVPLLSEIYRILKPSGYYIMTTPAPWADFILRIMGYLRMINPILLAEHKGAYNHAAVSNYLKLAGFSPEKMEFGSFELFANLWVKARK